MNFDQLKEELQNSYYATLPFGLRQHDFNKAMEIFLKFLTLPQEKKEQLYFKINPDDRGSEVGYKRYIRDVGYTDNREYVHYHSLAETHFSDIRNSIPEFDALLTAMKGIHDAAVIKLREIISLFESEFPGIQDKFFPQGKLSKTYLRFLKYDRAGTGDFLAKGHYDRGGCTLALAESAPGLRIGIGPDNLQNIVHRDGEALFFPGIRFPEVTSEEFIPAWRDVIQLNEHTYSDTIARWAIVLFADPEIMTSISYEQAHTPLSILK